MARFPFRRISLKDVAVGSSNSRLAKIGWPMLLAILSLLTIATSPPLKQPTVVDIVADEHYPNILYATVRDYVRDTGSLWSILSTGEPRLFRTIDGGDSWQDFGTGGERTLPDPAKQGVFYALRLDGVWRFNGLSTSYRGIWPLDDEASEKLGPVGKGMPMLAPPWIPNLLYIGVRGAVMRSYDAGMTWKSMQLPGSSEDPVTLLSAAPSRPGLLFAAQNRQLFRSENWGNTWIQMPDAKEPFVEIKVDPNNDNLLIGGTSDRLLKSLDGGWDWKTVWLTESDTAGPISSIVFDVRNQDIVYAAVQRYGLISSDNAGETWHDRLRRDVHALAVTRSRNSHIFVAAGPDGVYRQRDRIRWPWLGEWEHVNSGLHIGAAGFGHRIVNLVSWLVFLCGTVIVARLTASGRLRKFIHDYSWQITLTILTLAQVWLLLGRILDSQQRAETLDESLLLVAILAWGVIFILFNARFSWVLWGLTALPLLLMVRAIVVIHQNWPAFGFFGPPLLPFAVLVIAVGLSSSAVLLQGRKEQAAKYVLVATVTLINFSHWIAIVVALAFGILR